MTRPTELSKQITHCEKSGWYRCQPPDVDKAKHRRKMLVSACSICQPKQQECCVNTILYRQQWSDLVTFISTHYLPTINTKYIYSPQQKLDRPRVSQTGLQHLTEYTRFIQVSERQHRVHMQSLTANTECTFHTLQEIHVLSIFMLSHQYHWIYRICFLHKALLLYYTIILLSLL